MTRTSEIEQIKAELRAEFPGLSIIQGNPRGRWFAFSGPVDPKGDRPFVDVEAGSAEELRALLRKQCGGDAP